MTSRHHRTSDADEGTVWATAGGFARLAVTRSETRRGEGRYEIASMTTIARWLSVVDATAAVDFYRRVRCLYGELVEFDGVVEVAELFVG